MKRTRVVAALAVGAVAAGGLSACSSDTGGGDGGPVTISIMEFQQTRIDSVKELIPGFEAAMKEQGKDIEVELIADPPTADQFKTKITQQTLAGQRSEEHRVGQERVRSFRSR